MNAPDALSDKIVARTDDELLAMLAAPDDWNPEALAIARSELGRRNVPRERIAQAEAEIHAGQAFGRPVLITILCVLGFIGFPVSILMVFFSDATRSLGEWHQILILFNTIVRLILTFGLWNMRRWAFYGDAALTAFTQAVLFAMDQWTPVAIIISGICLAIQLIYLPRMKRGWGFA